MATRQCGFGFRLSGSVLLLVGLCLARGDSGVLAQSQSQSNYADQLSAMEKRFVAYGQDFLDFAKAASDAPGDELEIAADLQTVGGETADKLYAARTLMQIYSAMSCAEDRPIVRPFVERDLHYYSQQIEISIKEANLYIASTKRPGVAAEASRMRDDLREVKSALDSMKLR